MGSKIEELFDAVEKGKKSLHRGYLVQAGVYLEVASKLLPAARAEWKRAKKLNETIQDERNSDEPE